MADEHCILCNSPLEIGEYTICRNCIAKENLFDTFQLQVPNNPMEMRLQGSGITAASALMTYQQDEVSQKLIHDLKYNGKRIIAELLGKAIAERVERSPRYAGIDYVVPMPIQCNKQKRRGYNQSELIAIRVAKEIDKPLITDQLIRISDDESQASKDLEERSKTHIEFLLRSESLFEGKRILLIDDVFTTGTTVLNCMEAFRQVKGIQVVLYTAA